MNPNYQRIISASDADRRDLFVSAARRLGTAEQNVEKDFWVCWILDILFHGLPDGGPRLLFKGGTSLSKAFGLTNRFSEDIDITAFREDLGMPGSLEELEGLSGKKRKAQLEAIMQASQEYVRDVLHPQLQAVSAESARAAGQPSRSVSVEVDEDDPDGQTLIFRYPSVVIARDEYVRPSVRIECGARSAVNPHVACSVEAYIASDVRDLNLVVQDIRTIEPKRTFWDKVLTLHGFRRWHDKRGELIREGQRVTRHYYDIHSLVHSKAGALAEADLALATDCARHARVFFHRPDMDLASAVPGSFSLIPTPGMMDGLREDYTRMAGMIIGIVPSFEDVMASITDLEHRLNRHPA